MKTKQRRIVDSICGLLKGYFAVKQTPKTGMHELTRRAIMAQKTQMEKK